MRDILINQLSNIKFKLEEAYTDRLGCGIETQGIYEIKIRDLEKQFNSIENKIKDIDKAQSPTEVQIYCFIICSTHRQIKKTLRNNLFKFIKIDRYDDTSLEKWRPFNPGETIEELLKEYKNDKGYSFQAEYISGEPKGETLALIDKVKKDSIAIIDLLSIDHINALVCQRFDTKDIGGVIMPYCRNLHLGLKSEMDMVRGKYFKTIEYYANAASPSIYIYEITMKQSFFQYLSYIFFNKFKIKNEINTSSLVRGLNITL